jgi:hypothetical protein
LRTHRRAKIGLIAQSCKRSGVLSVDLSVGNADI